MVALISSFSTTQKYSVDSAMRIFGEKQGEPLMVDVFYVNSPTPSRFNSVITDLNNRVQGGKIACNLQQKLQIAELARTVNGTPLTNKQAKPMAIFIAKMLGKSDLPIEKVKIYEID